MPGVGPEQAFFLFVLPDKLVDAFVRYHWDVVKFCKPNNLFGRPLLLRQLLNNKLSCLIGKLTRAAKSFLSLCAKLLCKTGRICSLFLVAVDLPVNGTLVRIQKLSHSFYRCLCL